MAYFTKFPKLLYDLQNNNEFKLIPDIFRRKGSLGGPGALDRASLGPFGTRDKTACRTKRGPLHNFRTLFQACSGPSQTWRGQFQPFKGP